MTKTTIKELKRGDFFRLKETDTAPVWVRDDYVRTPRKYYGYKWEDVNHGREFKNSQVVFIGFTY